MIDFLIKLLPYVAPAIVFADNFYWPWQAKNWKSLVAWPFLVAYTLFVWIADMVMAHTLMVHKFGFPKRGEWTISHTLERLYREENYEAMLLAWAINNVSPGHIKAAIK